MKWDSQVKKKSLYQRNTLFIAIQIYCVNDTVISGKFALNLLAPLVTDFNKRIITFLFDALFGTSARHFVALHFFFDA